MSQIDLRIGPPATGKNFYKRPALIAKLLRALRRGNVAFLGPRRTGKTSCLEEIKANPGGFLPILLNLERCSSVEGWLEAMLDGLRKALEKPEHQLDWVKGHAAAFLGRLTKITLPAVGGIELKDRRSSAPPWQKTADAFLQLLADTDAPVLFLLDEFPTFLKLVAQKKRPHGGRSRLELVPRRPA
ncbi:MAG: ATP-binding protein [Verrucomicrobiaceae bacterium]|nr:ATP-binding protein [Verrucomicrobiaceae bacterium]